MKVQPRAAVLGLLLASACAPPAQRRVTGPPPELQDAEHINTPAVQSLDGFSQAVRVGTSVYVSGQVALDSVGALVGGTDLQRQVDQSLANLSRVLLAARALPADVVHLTVYVVNYTPADYPVVRAAVTAFMPPGKTPALTLVGVAALPAPGLRVAIDAVAHVRGEFIDRDRMRAPGVSPMH